MDYCIAFFGFFYLKKIFFLKLLLKNNFELFEFLQISCHHVKPMSNPNPIKLSIFDLSAESPAGNLAQN